MKILSKIFKEVLLCGLVDISMCGSRLGILGIFFFCVINMGVNWRNLIQIKLNEVTHNQSARTINSTEVNKIEPYAPAQLHEIDNTVKHDKKLHKLSPIAVKTIRHFMTTSKKIKRKKRWNNKTNQGDRPNGINKDNIMDIHVTKNHTIQRSKHFTTLLINIQSIKCKDNLLLDKLITNKVDMCIVTETWLKEQDQLWLETNDLVQNGYKIDNVNRPNRTGGGLAIIYRSSIDTKLLKKGLTHNVEYALWECKTSGTLINMLAIYHPPYSSTNKCMDAMFLDDFAELIEEVLVSYGKIVCMVDFNLHVNNMENPDAQVFLDMITAFSLKKHVAFPTHRSGHTLDLVITESVSPLSVQHTKPGFIL